MRKIHIQQGLQHFLRISDMVSIVIAEYYNREEQTIDTIVLYIWLL